MRLLGGPDTATLPLSYTNCFSLPMSFGQFKVAPTSCGHSQVVADESTRLLAQTGAGIVKLIAMAVAIKILSQ